MHRFKLKSIRLLQFNFPCENAQRLTFTLCICTPMFDSQVSIDVGEKQLSRRATQCCPGARGARPCHRPPSNRTRADYCKHTMLRVNRERQTRRITFYR